MGLDWIGRQVFSGNRDVFVVSVANLEHLPSQLAGLPCSRFVLLLAQDANANRTHLDPVLEQLLDRGCVYLCAWGPGCELVHDVMDETVVMRKVDGGPEQTIMTTWHSRDSLAEATDFALQLARPDDALADGCNATVLAVVGNNQWLTEVRAAAREIIRSPTTAEEAIAAAERMLPGERAPEQAIDPRWQAIIVVSEFLTTAPEALWPFTLRWGSHPDDDLRMAIATCVLEHLLEHHFDLLIARVETAAMASPEFADTVLSCSKFGQAAESDRSARFDQLRAKLRDTKRPPRSGRRNRSRP